MGAMNKSEAIRWFHEITGGAGVDRESALGAIRRGKIAEAKWNDPDFVLGIEYGALIALVRVFGITRGELEMSAATSKCCAIVSEYASQNGLRVLSKQAPCDLPLGHSGSCEWSRRIEREPKKPSDSDRYNLPGEDLG